MISKIQFVRNFESLWSLESVAIVDRGSIHHFELFDSQNEKKKLERERERETSTVTRGG